MQLHPPPEKRKMVRVPDCSFAYSDAPLGGGERARRLGAATSRLYFVEVAEHVGIAAFSEYSMGDNSFSTLLTV